jgi:NAD(P)-dependent dehydrogenase (short-subunit alcohol dehydrogenase family)
VTDKKIWFITGAGRGMGLEFAKAALAAGDAVRRDRPQPRGRRRGGRPGRRPAGRQARRHQHRRRRSGGVGRRRPLRPHRRAGQQRGPFYAGYFEELAPEQIERQLATTLIGPMDVARAVLPVMRKQRSGHRVSISSGAGLVGFEFCSAYAASKFGLEGWMESLEPEVAPFGIHTTIVEPASFRTEILTRKSGDLRRVVHPGLRRPHRGAAAAVGGAERQAARRPRQARPGTAASQARSRPRPVHRRRCCDRPGRAEGRRPAAGDKRLPGAVHVAGRRRGRSRRELELDRCAQLSSCARSARRCSRRPTATCGPRPSPQSECPPLPRLLGAVAGGPAAAHRETEPVEAEPRGRRAAEQAPRGLWPRASRCRVWTAARTRNRAARYFRRGRVRGGSTARALATATTRPLVLTG